MSEMSDDDVRTRLSRLDPAPADVPVDPPTSPRARELVERIMQTPQQQTHTQPQIPAQASPAPVHDLVDEASGRPGRPWLLGLAAAVLVVVLMGVVLVIGGGEAGDTPGGQDPTTLALELPPSDIAGSCLVFDVGMLAEMPVAFAGTVSAIGAGQVTIDVDRWYRGGDADQVAVAIPEGQPTAALDGVDFREGERYLVTATDGTVNGCGFSGPADPQLEQAFQRAFGG